MPDLNRTILTPAAARQKRRLSAIVGLVLMFAPLVSLLGIILAMTGSFQSLAQRVEPVSNAALSKYISFFVSATPWALVAGAVGSLLAAFAIVGGNRERWFYSNGVVLSLLNLPLGLITFVLFLSRRREFLLPLSS